METAALMHKLFSPGDTRLNRGQGKLNKKIMPQEKLPSRFQIEDQVLFSFGSESVFARVLAVKFTASKVKYDIAVSLSGNEHRFYNIESDFVIPIPD